MNELEKEGLFYVLAVPRRIGEWTEYHDKKMKEFLIWGRRAILYENKELRNKLLEELEEVLNKVEKDLKILSPSEIKRKYPHVIKFINLRKKTFRTNMIQKEKKVEMIGQ